MNDVRRPNHYTFIHTCTHFRAAMVSAARCPMPYYPLPCYHGILQYYTNGACMCNNSIQLFKFKLVLIVQRGFVPNAQNRMHLIGFLALTFLILLMIYIDSLATVIFECAGRQQTNNFAIMKIVINCRELWNFAQFYLIRHIFRPILEIREIEVTH